MAARRKFFQGALQGAGQMAGMIGRDQLAKRKNPPAETKSAFMQNPTPDGGLESSQVDPNHLMMGGLMPALIHMLFQKRNG